MNCKYGKIVEETLFCRTIDMDGVHASIYCAVEWSIMQTHYCRRLEGFCSLYESISLFSIWVHSI